MAIKGAQNGFADERTTLPVCGMYCSKNKAGNAYTLYIDHFTTAAKEKRSYKMIPILTRDPDSLFMRLSTAFGVKHAPRVTQLHAAKALALAVAQKGALKCKRAGKAHDWVDIAPVDIDGDKLPWCQPEKEGMRMIDLWVFSTEEPAAPVAQATPPETDMDGLLKLMDMGMSPVVLNVDDI